MKSTLGSKSQHLLSAAFKTAYVFDAFELYGNLLELTFQTHAGTFENTFHDHEVNGI